MNGKKLFRSDTDKKLTGLCGGVGAFFNVDSTIVRIILVLVALFTAVVPVAIGYFIIALIVPVEGEEEQQGNGPRDVDYRFVDNDKNNGSGTKS